MALWKVYVQGVVMIDACFSAMVVEGADILSLRGKYHCHMYVPNAVDNRNSM